MLFTWDTTDLCVVFRWWHVRGPWSLFFTLIGVVFLGMSYELLRLAARKYDENIFGQVRLGTPTHDDDTDRPPLTTGSGRYPSPLHPTNTSMDSDTFRLGRRRHIIRAILYGAQVFYSYLLMLVAMTYQVILPRWSLSMLTFRGMYLLQLGLVRRWAFIYFMMTELAVLRTWPVIRQRNSKSYPFHPGVLCKCIIFLSSFIYLLNSVPLFPAPLLWLLSSFIVYFLHYST